MAWPVLNGSAEDILDFCFIDAMPVDVRLIRGGVDVVPNLHPLILGRPADKTNHRGLVRSPPGQGHPGRVRLTPTLRNGWQDGRDAAASDRWDLPPGALRAQDWSPQDQDDRINVRRTFCVSAAAA